jgi:hypothetical protein
VRNIWPDEIYSNLEKTRSDYKLEQEAHGRTRDALTEAKDQIKKLTRERDEVRSQSRILELFGEGFWLYQSFPLTRGVANVVTINPPSDNCGREPCYSLKLFLDESRAKPEVVLWFEGLGFGNTVPSRSVQEILALIMASATQATHVLGGSS